MSYDIVSHVREKERERERERESVCVCVCVYVCGCVRGSILIETAHPGQPGTIVTICMSCFMTGDPDKEYGTNKPPPTGRVWERLKGDIE